MSTPGRLKPAEVALLDVHPAREEPVGALAGVSGLQVAQAAERMGGKRVLWLPEADSARGALADLLARNATLGVEDQILVAIGAGDVFELGEALIGEERDSAVPFRRMAGKTNSGAGGES